MDSTSLTLAHVDEVCPHCGVGLYTDVEVEHARQGFDCPACGEGLRWADQTRGRVLAISSFSIGSLFSLAIGGVGMIMLSSVPVMIVREAWDIYPSLCVIVSAVCLACVALTARWVWRAQRPLISVIRGRRLIPATRFPDGSYRYNLAPKPTTFRKVLSDEELGGALSMDTGHADEKGRLSMNKKEI